MTAVPAKTVLVPLADESDAERTCRALEEYLSLEGTVVAVHVVEKAQGPPDKSGVEQRAERADRIFLIARQRLETETRSVESRLLFGSNIAETIFQAAEDADADLIVFSPREASRLARLLSGDVALDLITDPELPVLVLPDPDDNDQE